MIKTIARQFEDDLKACSSSKELEALRVKYFGKKGELQNLMQSLRSASAEERPLLGKQINDLKESLSAKLQQTIDQFENAELNRQLAAEKIDVTLPGIRQDIGNQHVIVKMLNEAISLLRGMGFSVQYGPDIDSEYYNFEALNFAQDHPARDMQDTFYIQPGWLLRTHTSNTQARVLESGKPPIRAIAPGKCFRNEDISSRSHVVFHQIEGFYVDKHVTFSDLLSTLEELFTKLLKREVKMRFRPSYFPFVEPGVEVDVHCIICEGKGCSVCKKAGWLEVAGAGMIHPEVLKSAGIDPETHSGYAWGFGIERIAMLRYGISDIRLFQENRMDFLKQF